MRYCLPAGSTVRGGHTAQARCSLGIMTVAWLGVVVGCLGPQGCRCLCPLPSLPHVLPHVLAALAPPSLIRSIRLMLSIYLSMPALPAPSSCTCCHVLPRDLPHTASVLQTGSRAFAQDEDEEDEPAPPPARKPSGPPAVAGAAVGKAANVNGAAPGRAGSMGWRMCDVMQVVWGLSTW